MTRLQTVLLVPRSVAQALGVTLVLGLAFAAQIPSTVEAAGIKKSSGSLGGFGARGGWNRGGQNLNGTATQTAPLGFRPGSGVWGGWDRTDPSLAGPSMRSPSGRVLHTGKSSPQGQGRPGSSVDGLRGAGRGQKGGNGRSGWTGWSDFYRSF
jgi:hypothetical protein